MQNQIVYHAKPVAILHSPHAVPGVGTMSGAPVLPNGTLTSHLQDPNCMLSRMDDQ
jgi:hypothetical protein